MPNFLIKTAKLSLRKAPGLTQAARRMVNRGLGIDIIRHYPDPETSLLGLASLPIHTIFDIGAHDGSSARMYRRLFPQANIYCFEPLADVFSTLQAWAGKETGITAFNMGLGEKEESLTINRTQGLESSSFLQPSPHGIDIYPSATIESREVVKVTRLDRISEQCELRDGILVKVDAQGYELKIIRGGKLLLQRAAGCILEVCLQSIYEQQPAFVDLIEAMSDVGLHYAGNLKQIVDASGAVVYLDAVFRRSLQSP